MGWAKDQASISRKCLLPVLLPQPPVPPPSACSLPLPDLRVSMLCSWRLGNCQSPPVTLLVPSTGQIAGIAIAILIVLFLVQRLGTDKVGYTFAPIILTWFIFIAGIGLYNLLKHDTGVLKAFNPKYIVDYFQINGEAGLDFTWRCYSMHYRN